MSSLIHGGKTSSNEDQHTNINARRVYVSDKLTIPLKTGSERDADLFPIESEIILNRTTSQLNYRVGESWHIVEATGTTGGWTIGGDTLAAQGSIGSLNANGISLITNGDSRLTISSSGAISIPSFSDGIIRCTGSVISSSSLSTSDLPTIPYSKLALSNSIVNGDIVSLDYGKLTNVPASASTLAMLDSSVGKVACGILRFTYLDGVYSGSIVNGHGIYFGAIAHVADSEVYMRVNLTATLTSCWSAVVTCGRLPFAGVYIPRIESDITNGPVTEIDVRLYASYDGSPLGSLPSNGNYDFHITIMGSV